MINVKKPAVSGVFPPQSGEAMIRESFPSLTAFPTVATLGRKLILSIVGAPLGWFLMLPFYFSKILPFVARRYTVTNRRVMIQRGLKPAPIWEVLLADIDEVHVVKDENSDFFRAGNLVIVSRGKVVMTLEGVSEPDSFRHCIVNSVYAWVPGKAKGPFVPASAK